MSSTHQEERAMAITAGIVHIYDNKTGKRVATIEGEDNAECERKADAEYGSNDYHWSYCEADRSNAIDDDEVAE